MFFRIQDDPYVANRYDDFAYEYEITCQDKTDDLEFYLKKLSDLKRKNEPSKRILEVGCGTGRVSIFLAKHGFTVTGIDISKEMLNIARKKICDDYKGWVNFYQQDMRQVKLPKEKLFDLIILPFSCFAHIFSSNDQEMVLRKIHAHLAPNGNLIISLHNWVKYHSKLYRPIFSQTEAFEGIFYDKGYTKIVKFSVKQYNSLAKVAKIWHVYDIYENYSEHYERKINVFPLNCIRYQDMCEKLEKVNLEIDSIYGDYNFSDFDFLKSPRMIFVAKRSVPN